MVLLQVDPQGIAIVKLEGDAPRAVHMDRVARRLRTMQSVKVKSGEVHVLGLFGVVQRFKPGKDATDKAGVDFGRPAGLPQVRKSFVSERLDHVSM